MRVRVLENVHTCGRILEPGVGDFDPEFAQHLIDVGVAEAYEVKMMEVETVKKSLPVSPAAPASRKKIAKRSKVKPQP